MVGASTVDPGPLYYGRRDNKAVITQVERADMQMAALATPTHCLILSGDGQPHEGALREAQDKGVSIIQAKQDIFSIIANIEDSLSRARFRQEQKLAHIGRLLQDAFDFAALGMN